MSHVYTIKAENLSGISLETGKCTKITTQAARRGLFPGPQQSTTQHCRRKSAPSKTKRFPVVLHNAPINCMTPSPGRWWGFDQGGVKCILKPQPGTDEMVKQPHPGAARGTSGMFARPRPWSIESVRVHAKISAD